MKLMMEKKMMNEVDDEKKMDDGKEIGDGLDLRKKLMMKKKLFDKYYYKGFGYYLRRLRDKEDKVCVIKDVSIAVQTAMEMNLVFNKPISEKVEEEFCFEMVCKGMLYVANLSHH